MRRFWPVWPGRAALYGAFDGGRELVDAKRLLQQDGFIAAVQVGRIGIAGDHEYDRQARPVPRARRISSVPDIPGIA